MTVRNLRFAVLGCAVLSLIACASRDSPTANIEGQAVADRLNARYLHTVDDCAGQPAFKCSGVPVRVLDPFIPDLQPLDPTPVQIARNGASFSFIRKDLGIEHLYQGGWAGYVVDLQEQPGFYSLQVRCAFPTNGSTDSRPDSCGHSKDDMTPTLRSRPCARQGIDSAQAWGAHFNSLPDRRYSCAFDASAREFQLSMASRAFISEDSDRHREWNELVIANWKQEDVRLLPVEAVFYSGLDLPPFTFVQRHQCRIYHATGRRVPLLRLDIAREDGAIFSFNPADQIDFDGTPPDCNYLPIPTAKS